MRLVALLIVAVIWSGAGCDRKTAAEPTFQGRSITEWVRLASDKDPATQKQTIPALVSFAPDKRAESALRALATSEDDMGTDALIGLCGHFFNPADRTVARDRLIAALRSERPVAEAARVSRLAISVSPADVPLVRKELDGVQKSYRAKADQEVLSDIRNSLKIIEDVDKEMNGTAHATPPSQP